MTPTPDRMCRQCGLEFPYGLRGCPHCERRDWPLSRREISSRPRRSFNFEAFLGVAIVVVGPMLLGIFLAAGAFQAWRKAHELERFQQDCATCHGTVVDTQWRSDSSINLKTGMVTDLDRYKLVVSYQFDGGSGTIRGEQLQNHRSTFSPAEMESIGLRVPGPTKGDRIEVYYLPDSPQVNRLERPTEPEIEEARPSSLVVLLAILFIAMPVGLLSMMRRS